MFRRSREIGPVCLSSRSVNELVFPYGTIVHDLAALSHLSTLEIRSRVARDALSETSLEIEERRMYLVLVLNVFKESGLTGYHLLVYHRIFDSNAKWSWQLGSSHYSSYL